MRRSVSLWTMAAAGWIGLTAPAVLAGWKQVPVVRLDAQIEVAAKPADVWSHLTSGKNLVTWCPVWKAPSNAAINLTKVGDVLDYTDEWGNGGRSVVTFLAKEKEIRVAHEPNDGSYLCQAKLTLEPTPGGTMVRYIEQYTDEQPAEAVQATAQKVEDSMKLTLEALKKSVAMK